jgi:predicted transcriptional regulator
MDELDININSDETTYINDSEHSKSENNIIDSEHDLNTSNNNKDSETVLINLDIQNKKMYSNILPMSKARRTHLTQLNTLARKITDDRIKDNVKNVLNLYENKNISQFTTAQKLIKSFISNNEKMIKKAELNLEKHKKAKPIDERMQAKYVRVEHKNMDKPQSNIKFKISQTYPNYNKALTTLKQKFITTMKIYLIQDLIIGFV